MVCRHGPGDPDCSKNGGGWVRDQQVYQDRRIKELEAQLAAPDNSKYSIVQFERVGDHVAMKVQYEVCDGCKDKLMVFLNVSEAEVLKWRRIDPHFRPGEKPNGTTSPSPAARFPPTDQGWKDAVAYADSKTGAKPKTW